MDDETQSKPEPTADTWLSVDAVGAAIADDQLGSLSRVFRADDAAHQTTLLALGDEEARLLTNSDRMVAKLAHLGTRLASAGRFTDALKVFDVAIEGRRVDLSVFCNALYSVMNHNHHLGVMKDRARHYLEVALPHGPANPGIYHNAACVQLELGDTEAAIASVREAVGWGYTGVEALRKDEFLASLRSDPRFDTAFTDPALLAERRERVLPQALAALAALQAKDGWDRGDVDFEMDGRFETPNETREWMEAWTGNEAPPADKLRVFGQDGSGGKVGFWRTDKEKRLDAEPVVFFGSEGELGVVAEDLPDFLTLMAAGVSPGHAVAYGVEALRAPQEAVASLLLEEYPEAATRSVEEVIADAKGAVPDFQGTIRALTKY